MRRRAGRGFTYLHTDGSPIRDPELLDRIKGLAIPPAWTDVWICPWDNGHIQALGTDAAGRRQYRYHDAWRARRDQEKFDHMVDFARCLPGLRQSCAELLRGDDLGPERVLACAVRLLDRGFFRIGTEGYARQNQTYGLATMRRDHVTISTDDLVRFDFIAKSGKRRLQTIVDPDVAAVLRALKRRRGGGSELLAFRNTQGGWTDVRSGDINEFVKARTGGDFTAKDFRTWSATVLAAVALSVSDGATSATARRRAVVRAVQEVSAYLGNTPAVCRRSYIDPRIIDCYDNGVTIRDGLHLLGREAVFGELSTQGAFEAAVLDLLVDPPSGQAAA